jgi:hypothetical protein
MKKTIIIFTILLTSCSSAPEGFCDCMKKGEELNVQTQAVLAGRASDDMKRKMIKIRAEKNKACENFLNSSGTDMRKWQEACK